MGASIVTNQNRGVGKAELERIALFRGVDLESIQGLLDDCEVRHLKAEEILIHAAQANYFLYLTLSGRVRIHLKLNLDPIVVMEAGEVVGELSMIDGQMTSAYVVAHEDCRVLKLDEKTMWSLVDSCPQIALNLLFTLAQRLRHGNQLVLTKQQIQREYERYAVIEALTGLYNHRYLEDSLGRYIGQSKKGGWSLSLLLIDIDDFQRYQDIYGRSASERLLYTVARTIRGSTRPGQIIARYEDRFIVLLPDVNAEAGREVGGEIRQTVSQAKVYSSHGDPLSPATVSVVVAEMIADDTPETFLSAAQETLVEIRKAGDNRVAVSDRSS